MRFEEIVGHQQLKKKLIETVTNNRVSHAQLFYGPEGNGSLLLAISYAQYLLCESPSEQDSCGACSSCRQISSFNFPDLHFVYPVASVGKSNSKPLSTDFSNEWKDIIQTDRYFGIYRWLEKLGIENKQAQIGVHESAEMLKKLQLKSYSGKHKILILWMPERMNISASNKLLKLLEEPPKKTVFLLVSQDPDALLKTITSRSQKIFVPKFTQTETLNFLQSEDGLNASSASVIARLADGNLDLAKRLAERADTYKDYAILFSQWVRSCFKADVKHIVEWSEECGRFEREKIKDFLSFCSQTFRDSLNIHYKTLEDHNQIFQEVNFELSKFAPFIHSTNTPKILEALDTAGYDISRNANPKVVLTDLSLNMARFLRVKS